MRLQRAVQGLNYVPNQYAGAGSPSATTLAVGLYSIGDLYLNTTASTLYVCVTAGSASTSVWALIGAGSGLTILGSSNATVTNTLVETTILSQSLPATPTAAARYICLLDGVIDTGQALTITFKIYLGATIYIQWVSTSVAAANGLHIYIDMFNRGVTSADVVVGRFYQDPASATSTTLPVTPANPTVTQDATAINDTTGLSGQTFKVTATLSVAAAGVGLDRVSCVLYQVQA